jgi:hypothetical protein
VRHVISITGITDMPIHSTALAANIALVMLALSPGVSLLEKALSVLKLLQIEILGGILCLHYIFVSAGRFSAAHSAESSVSHRCGSHIVPHFSGPLIRNGCLVNPAHHVSSFK